MGYRVFLSHPFYQDFPLSTNHFGDPSFVETPISTLKRKNHLISTVFEDFFELCKAIQSLVPAGATLVSWLLGAGDWVFVHGIYKILSTI